MVVVFVGDAPVDSAPSVVDCTVAVGDCVASVGGVAPAECGGADVGGCVVTAQSAGDTAQPVDGAAQPAGDTAQPVDGAAR